MHLHTQVELPPQEADNIVRERAEDCEQVSYVGARVSETTAATPWQECAEVLTGSKKAKNGVPVVSHSTWFFCDFECFGIPGGTSTAANPGRMRAENKENRCCSVAVT